MLTRRRFAAAGLAVAGAAVQVLGRTGGVLAAEPEIGENGLYTQDWFVDSFLDMRDDLVEATDEGKHFAVIWEQQGCPYCREMHLVNFANPKIREFVETNFFIVQLDLWGAREVTDFDGEAKEERAMARKWGVNFTPTIMFFDDDPDAAEGKSARAAEVVRMPGYFKPFHFLSMFEFVRGGHYRQTDFQRFLQAKLDDLEAKGEKPEVW